MIFQIFHIGSMVKEAKDNPGNFAGGQAIDVILGILILPALIILAGLTLLFFVAFTGFLGGPYLFFKILFFIGLGISIIGGLVLYKVISSLKKTTKNVVNKTIENIRNTDSNTTPSAESTL